MKNQADRHNDGKTQWSQLDWPSLEPMVRVLEYGAKKYERDNWKKGMPVTEVADSCLRHIFSFLDGEDVDMESGLSHIGHAMCNLMFLSYIMREKGREFDDRHREITALEVLVNLADAIGGAFEDSEEKVGRVPWYTHLRVVDYDPFMDAETPPRPFGEVRWEEEE